MSMTDPIADMLSRIQNGIRAGHDRVDVPASKLKREIARILQQEGFIADYELVEDAFQGILRIQLRYTEDGEPIIHGLERVSRPGRRVYRGKTEIPQVLDGLGVSIVSTSRGVLSGTEASRTGVGGEVLCQVW
ncbi:MAG: 30S ribosomal protein S8 [Thermoanaerobaculia bacterium]|nr:30S ribosomal protein S8 [Thermoanaerobaculia bacterium]